VRHIKIVAGTDHAGAEQVANTITKHVRKNYVK